MTTLTATCPIEPATEPADDAPEFPLVGPLRLNLAALGVDGNAPDFGERLCRLSRDNECFQFEYSAKGELIIMPPTGPISSKGEQGANYSLFGWGLDNPGAFPQTVMFRLPAALNICPTPPGLLRTVRKPHRLGVERYD